MKIKKTLLAAVLTGGLFSATSTHAVLTLTLDGQGVYDDHLNITWLQNANLAATNTFGVSGIFANGRMNWYTAQSWINAMNAYNGTGYLGYNDWRLPTTLQPDTKCSYQWGSVSYGLNCTGSEMGHLFYNELGSTAGSSILSSSDPDLALFQNVQSLNYWSGTEYAPVTSNAWMFDTTSGYQTALGKGGFVMYAWAVRSGDSAATSPVPEPEMYVMLLTGIVLLSFTARRQRSVLR